MPRTQTKPPVHDLMIRQGRTVAAVARAIDIEYLALRGAVHGNHRPSPVIRERLPELLGMPLEELFHAEQLTEYRSRHRKPEPVA